MDFKELLNRIAEPVSARSEAGYDAEIEPPDADQNLRLLKDVGGAVTGRAMIYVSRAFWQRSGGRKTWYLGGSRLGLVTVGGLRSTKPSSIGGILVGRSARAARDEALPIASVDTLIHWANEQARLVHSPNSDIESQVAIAQVIRALGADPGEMPVAQSASGWLSATEIAAQEQPDEVYLVQDAAVSNAQNELSAETFKLKSGVFSVAMGQPGLLQTQSRHHIHWPPYKYLSNGQLWLRGLTLEGLVIEALATAWDSTVEDVIQVSEFSSDDTELVREVAIADGEAVTEGVDVVRNPAKHY